MTPSSGALPFSLKAYRAATARAAPVLDWLLARRLAKDKEAKAHIGERRGVATRQRPRGRLIWLHAVSVGEANSVLALIEALLERDALCHVLLTTGTVTAAGLMTTRLRQPRAILQFAPLDHPRWTARFLDHWRPDLALFVESELWPNLILNAQARGVPLVLINARMSARSFKRWQPARKTVRRLLSAFTLCLAQTAAAGARYAALGARDVLVTGNLKLAANPPPDQSEARAAFQGALGGRRRWLAASTHDGEERTIAEVHGALKRSDPDLLTLIAPRHPERGQALAAALGSLGLNVARRSLNEPPVGDTDIYLVDTLGELGLFYRIAPIVFMGGSLVARGGQNPLEPAQLGCAIIVGPSTDNFSEIYDALELSGAVIRIAKADDLTERVHALLHDHDRQERQSRAALAFSAKSHDVLDRVLEALGPLLVANGDVEHNARP